MRTCDPPRKICLQAFTSHDSLHDAEAFSDLAHALDTFPAMASGRGIIHPIFLPILMILHPENPEGCFI